MSAVLQYKLPPKCKDPSMFTIPCIIGNKKIERAMLDLGASINVMPYSIYASLELGPMKETGVIIQLADRSNAYPEGVVEDVLVQINELIFPADFYVLHMEDGHALQSSPILFGRPFLKTARTKIDVHEGTLSTEFDNELMKFSIFDAMRHPHDPHAVFSIDVVAVIMQEMFNLHRDDDLQVVISQGLNETDLDMLINLEMEETIMALQSLHPCRYNVCKLDLPPLNDCCCHLCYKHQIWN